MAVLHHLCLGTGWPQQEFSTDILCWLVVYGSIWCKPKWDIVTAAWRCLSGFWRVTDEHANNTMLSSRRFQQWGRRWIITTVHRFFFTRSLKCAFRKLHDAIHGHMVAHPALMLSATAIGSLWRLKHFLLVLLYPSAHTFKRLLPLIECNKKN